MLSVSCVRAATVTGSISLEGVPDLSAVSQYAPLGTFHVSLRNAINGTETKAVDATLTTIGGSPTGTFSIASVPAGTYNVVIKGTKSLAVLSPNVIVNRSSGTISEVTLPAGDANNDNSIDTMDFGLLIGAFNTAGSIADGGYNSAVDFNYDGYVDNTDFGLLIGNFGSRGD